jgi:hypothetical protein
MSGGALDASVTLDEVLTVVGAKRVPLAPELAGYLVLELAEHADPAGGDVDARSVFVGDEGTVAMIRARRERVVGDAETSIRAALGRLLEASGSQTPALSAASKRQNGAGLGALAAELEAALIPVNRAAARRALARLAREVKRITLGVGRHTLGSSSPGSSLRSSLREPLSFVAEPVSEPRRGGSSSKPMFPVEEDPTTARSKIPSELLKGAPAVRPHEMPTADFAVDRRAPSASEADLDALIAQFRVSGTEQQHARALKAIAELEPTPAPPAGGMTLRPSSRPPPADPLARPRESDIEALLAMHHESPVMPPPAARTPPPPTGARSSPARARESRSSSPPASRAPADSERQLPTQPSQLKRRASLPSAPSVRRKRGAGWPVLVGLLAVAAGSYAVWRLRPEVFARRQAGPAPSTAAPPGEAPPACVGTLIVTDVPSRAEVLLREGQAPVDIPRMPVGARLEFVATADGFAPKRVVVPAGVPWDPGPDGKPRFEAAVQLDASRATGGVSDSWPVGEPGSAVGGEGPPGTVRVVATPRAAEVWMLAGIAPEARIDHLRCEQDIDVLLAGPTTYRNRLRVRAADFVPDDATGGGPSPPALRSSPKLRVARVSGK